MVWQWKTMQMCNAIYDVLSPCLETPLKNFMSDRWFKVSKQVQAEEEGVPYVGFLHLTSWALSTFSNTFEWDRLIISPWIRNRKLASPVSQQGYFVWRYQGRAMQPGHLFSERLRQPRSRGSVPKPPLLRCRKRFLSRSLGCIGLAYLMITWLFAWANAWRRGPSAMTRSL